MRILINALPLLRGGGQVHLENLLQQHRPRDLEIYVVCPEGLEVSDLVGSGRLLSAPQATKNIFIRALWEFFFLPFVIRKYEIDLLFCPGGIAVTPRFGKLKIATMFQNMSPFDLKRLKKYPFGKTKLRNLVLQKVMLFSMGRSDRVIFISDYARNVILNLIPKISGKDTVIPHGISDNFLRLQKKPDWLPPNSFLYVSTIDFYKNQLEVVRAYAIMRDRFKDLGPLLLVGHEDRLYGKVVRQEIIKLNLQKEVILTGPKPRDDLPGAYQNCRIIIFASTVENCPNILLESIASAKPILCSNIKPMPEFGGSGVLYFDPDRVEDLVEKWTLFLQRQDLQQEYSARAMHESSFYKWEDTAEKTWMHLISD